MDLIERDQPLGALRSLLDAATLGRGRVGIVRAPAGGGKTAVIGALSRLAADRELTVLGAVGVEQEMVIPYGVVHQLIDPLVRREPQLVTDGPPARAWAQLTTGHTADQTVPRGLHWLLEDAAESRPMLVVVDDHHWCDPPSSAFIEYLARRIATSPIALIVASRDAASTLELSASSTVQVDLEPLTQTGVQAIAATWLGTSTDELAEALWGATGGNPFLVHEALAVLRENPGVPADHAISSDLVASVRRQMRGLDPDARRTAEALAVLGPSPPPALVADVAGLDVATTLSCGDHLAAGHVTTNGAVFTLRHPLLRSALLALMASGQRSILHRRAADALSRRGASALDIGQHLLHTQPLADDNVARGLVAAGRAALDHGDPHAARLMLERARDEPLPVEENAEVAVQLGAAHRLLGDERAVDEFRRALDSAVTSDQQLVAIRGLLGVLLAFGRLDELDETMASELSQLIDHDPESGVTVEAELLSAARHATHATLWNADRLRRWAGRVTGQGPAERVLLANLATQAALDGESAEHAAALARTALAGHRLVTEQTADSLTVYQAIWQLTAADCLDEARTALDAAFADARKRGSTVGFALASLFTSYVDVARGDLTAAESNGNASLVAAEQLNSSWMAFPAVVAAVIEISIERGELEPSWALLERHGLLGSLPDSTPHRLLLYARARLHHVCGNSGEALADADELVARQTAANVLSAHLVPSRAIAALAHAQRGDIGAGRQLSEDNLRLATAWGTPRMIGRALVVLAQLQHPDLAYETLDDAIDHLAQAPARLDQAWARYHRGLNNVRLGRRADAVADVRLALDVAADCGATALERASRQTLVQLGLRPRRSAASGPGALTVSERQVVELAAQGHTNRNIATALFVTPRTVETHLTSAYRKLGIQGRGQLAAALGADSARPTQG